MKSSWFAVAAPCIFTVIRISSGLYAIGATVQARFDHAAIAIGVALLSDLFDGKVARLLGSASDFGTQLDSLADVVGFGVAPAVLAFYWGVIRTPLGDLAGFLTCCAYVSCTVFRLARFNVSAPSPGFVGLPTPGAAGVVAAVVFFVKTPLNQWKVTALWLAVLLILSALMVSRFRYALPLPRWLQRPLLIVGIVLLWLYPAATALIAAVLFALSGIVVRRMS